MSHRPKTTTATFYTVGCDNVDVEVPDDTDITALFDRPEARYASDIRIMGPAGLKQIAWRTLDGPWVLGSFMEQFRILTKYNWNSGRDRAWVKMRSEEGPFGGLRDALDEGEFDSIEALAAYWREFIMDDEDRADIYEVPPG